MVPVHPATQQQLTQLKSNPPHAILLVGPSGVGKKGLARELAAELLGITAESLGNHAEVQQLASNPITIDMVRDVQHFLSRKPTSGAAVSRLVLLHQADNMTLEAQNAFLKTLEEPPAAAIIVATANDANALLPTIRSRVQSVAVHVPDVDDVKKYFAGQGLAAADIQKAVMMSGGLPDLMRELLEGNESHPLIQAAETARNILRLDTFGRLALVDSLSKQREASRNVCFMLQQMSRVVLRDSKRQPAVQRQWNTIMQEAHEAERALDTQASVKLVLTNFLISI